MSHIENALNRGLLAYAISTNPNPLQVSPSTGNPTLTSIVVTVSNNGTKPVYCDKIVFTIPIGTLARDLAEDGNGILVSANPSSKWQISETGTGSGIFTATPLSNKPEEIARDGLSFQMFNITTNKQVGTFTFEADEYSGLSANNIKKRENTFDLAKFPYGFYVCDFAASQPMVNNDEPVTLTWNGSDTATYTMIYGDKTADVTNVRSWTSPNLTQITTFSLKASTQQNGETVETYLFLTVVVSNPDITATSLKVINDSALDGNATIGDALTVAGPTGVKALTASSATVSGDVSAGGNTTTGSLSVNGGTSLANLALSGALTTSAPVCLLGGASLIWSGKNLKSTGKLATTDGFVMAKIGVPPTVTKMSLATANIYSGQWFTQSGGSTGTFGPAWSSYMVTNYTSTCVPVRAGTSFSIAADNWSENQQDSEISFYWFSLGSGSLAADLEDVEIDQSVIGAPPSIEGMMAAHSTGRIISAGALVDDLCSAFDKNLSKEERQELAARFAGL